LNLDGVKACMSGALKYGFGVFCVFLMAGWFWTLDDILKRNQYIWNCEAVGLHLGDVFNHFLQILGDKMGTEEQWRS